MREGRRGRRLPGLSRAVERAASGSWCVDSMFIGLKRWDNGREGGATRTISGTASRSGRARVMSEGAAHEVGRALLRGGGGGCGCGCGCDCCCCCCECAPRELAWPIFSCQPDSSWRPKRVAEVERGEGGSEEVAYVRLSPDQ